MEIYWKKAQRNGSREMSRTVKTFNKKKRIALVLMAFFVIASLIFISPNLRKPKSNYRSTELKEVTMKENGVTRVDYVDENGKITIAANHGYATKIVKTTDKGKIESFYDDHGNPVRRSEGYYQIFREYDKSGNNFRTTYLDLEGKPVIVYGGYAIEKKVFNEEKQVTEVYYYGKDGEPVFSSVNGYGKLNEYNENGKVWKIIHIDEAGKPVVTSLGYAIIERNYYVTSDYSNGRVESEFYFDADGSPIALALGEYGVHKEYDANGQAYAVTYLDAYGHPMVTNKGYTSVIRTFQSNNSIATEMYYDAEGNPYAMAEGQYGINKENGQTRYLNENGKQTFNIRNLLYNHSWMVIPAALIVVLLSSMLEKRENLILLFLYVGAILYLTLMFRESGDSTIRMEPFWSYKSFFSDSEERGDIFKNIWLFIPLGAILYQIWSKKWALLIPVVLSGCIEIVQYISGTGLCELDDVINNGIGGAIGYGISLFLKRIEPPKIRIASIYKGHVEEGEFLEEREDRGHLAE